MRDTLTGCPERALEPPERADQERLNRLQDMREAETAIGLYLEDYKQLFGIEIKNFLLDLRMRRRSYGASSTRRTKMTL